VLRNLERYLIRADYRTPDDPEKWQSAAIYAPKRPAGRIITAERDPATGPIFTNMAAKQRSGSPVLLPGHDEDLSDIQSGFT
jgi:hypothetical protein